MNGVTADKQSILPNHDGTMRSTEPLFARTWAVSPKLLLMIYGLIPIFLAIAALDLLALNGSIRDSLPHSPRYWAIWAILFQLPHVTSSIMTLADREYLKHYRHIVWRGLVLAAVLATLLPVILGLDALLFVLAAYTVYHVYMQQYGLSLMLLKRPPDIYWNLWKWLSLAGVCIGTIIVLYPKLLSSPALPIQITTHEALIASWVLFAVGTIPFFIFARRTLQNQPPIAKYYFFATPLLLLTGVVMFALGYLAVTIIIPRIVHDVTAYTVYIVHDHNRNLGTIKNFVYKLLRPFRISPALLCLPVSLGLACIITHFNEDFKAYGVDVINVMVFFHYYIEGNIWKGGSFHRRNTPFAPAGTNHAITG